MRRSNVRCRNGDGPVIERLFSTKIELTLISLPWPNGFRFATGRDEPLGQRLNGRQGKVAERWDCSRPGTSVRRTQRVRPHIPHPQNKKGPEDRPLFILAERVGFEPTCRNYPTIRFRVGAVMTTSVPLRLT
jgi:hypothetical protein